MTLTPSSTELVAAIAGPGCIVGTDRYSAQLSLWSGSPPPLVGDFLNPSFEAIVRLEPDLVVADELQSKVSRGLEGAGLASLALPMHRIEDVVSAAEELGRALHKEVEARRVVAGIRAGLAEARQRAQGRSRRMRVLVVLDRDPKTLAGLVAAGPGSYAAELVAAIGADNAVPAGAARYPRLSAEQVLRSAPDVIVDASPDAGAHLDAWQRMSTVPAVRNGRVVATTDRGVTAPSPGVARILAELDRMVYGPAKDE